MPVESAVIVVEVVHALPHRAILKTFALEAPATVADALAMAASDPDFRGIDLALPVGIFGLAVRADQHLREGDRIEIYRPLSADPKAARRARVRQARRDNPRKAQ